MSRFITTLALLFLLPSMVCAQQRVNGIVVDAQTDMPLPGANVYLLQAQVGDETDADGYFDIILSTNIQSDTLVFSFLGYRERRMALSDFQPRSRIRLESTNLRVQDSVLVQAERINIVEQEIPHARTVISAEAIELRGSSELGDLIKSVPSVRIEGNDLQGRRIQIRGSDANEVNVYIDGIQINALGVDNSADLSVIPLESVEKIEILKGANLTLLGGGAFGGVVNITTRKKLERSVFLKAKQGSFQTQYYLADVNVPITNRLAVNYFSQLSLQKPGIEFFSVEQYDSLKTINENLEIAKQNHHIGMNYYRDESELSTRVFGYFLDYDKPDLAIRRRNVLAASSLRGSFGLVRDVDFSINYLRGEDTNTRTNSANGEQFLDNLITNRINARFLKKFSFDVNDNQFQLLGEYVHDELTTNLDMVSNGLSTPRYRANIYENRAAIGGILALNNKIANRDDFRWKTHFGLRGDFIASGDQFVSPTLGFKITYERPSLEISPYASYGKNLKFITLSDNAYVALETVDADDSTLVRLKPEESNAFDVGFDIYYQSRSGSFESVDGSFAVFQVISFNKLLRLPFEPLTIRSQRGRNHTWGIEGSVRMNKLLERVNLQLSFMSLDIENRLFYVYRPERTYSIQADYLASEGLYLSSTFFYEGESVTWFPPTEQGQDHTDVETDIIDPFFDLDVVLGYRFKIKDLKLNLQASGYNVFDNSGYQFFLLKKRFYQVALSVRY